MHHSDPSESREGNSPSPDFINSNKGVDSSSRRSFLIKGVVAAPILAAFVSKPVWAVSDNCIVSGHMSGNLSNHQCAAVARSADWWANEALDSLWPTGTSYNGVALSPTATFLAVFSSNPLKNKLKNNVDTYHEKDKNATVFISLDTSAVQSSLRDVLRNQDATQVDKELIAALLNISHPGIAYDGYADPMSLISAYQLCCGDYLAGVDLKTEQLILNAMFSTFAENLARSNASFDEVP
jgi:hypothetical protein